MRAVASLVDVHSQMLKRLPLITAPVLMIASHGDTTAPPWHTQTMFERLRTADKQLVLVENSGHIVTRDLERERVAEAATAFVRRVTGWPNVAGEAGEAPMTTGISSPVILPGAEPFLFRRGRTGCLLLHGFTAAPQEVLAPRCPPGQPGVYGPRPAPRRARHFPRRSGAHALARLAGLGPGRIRHAAWGLRSDRPARRLDGWAALRAFGRRSAACRPGPDVDAHHAASVAAAPLAQAAQPARPAHPQGPAGLVRPIGQRRTDRLPGLLHARRWPRCRT